MKNEQISQEDFLGENHISTSAKTPLRDDAFELSEEEKIARIEKAMADIMHTLGLDLTDDSLKGTPRRVARPVPPETRSLTLYAEIPRSGIALYRFLLEGYDNLAVMSVVDRFRAVIRLRYATHAKKLPLLVAFN